MKKLGIYVHIPFCLSKCNYCGFYSHAGSAAEQEEYVEGLLRDIAEYGKTYGMPGGYSADTVFIGGGTPSIMKPRLTERIIISLRETFKFCENPEITIESNPKTLTEEKLRIYKASGINRLSIGLQSFDGNLLKILGRAHTAEDFLESFYMARKAGFDNVNVDLMFAIPGQTMGIWEDTLDRVIMLSPEHVSFYSLQIEEGTPFYEMFRRGEIDEIPDDTDRAMYHRAICKLREAGYLHYEISNCAKAGRECRHNLKYWSMDDYLGIGSGASSYIGGVRFRNKPFPEYHRNTFADETAEFAFTALRKTSGIDLKEFERRCGKGFWEVFGDRREELAEFFERGQLVEQDGVLRLSEEGMDISNRIMAVFV